MKNDTMMDCVSMTLKALEAYMVIVISIHETGEHEQTVTMTFDTTDDDLPNGSGKALQIVTENMVRALNTMLDDTEMQVCIRHKTTGEILPDPERFDAKHLHVRSPEPVKPS